MNQSGANYGSPVRSGTAVPRAKPRRSSPACGTKKQHPQKTLARFKSWWKRIWCEHFWRPALTSKGAAMFCDYCETTIQLSEQEYYARFGRIPRIGAV